MILMSSFEFVQPAAPARRRVVQAEEQAHRDARVGLSMERTAKALLAIQHPEGYWSGELTADSTLESDYVLLQLWLHPAEDAEWNPPTRSKLDKACQAILDRQLPDGGWEIFSGGGAEVNATVRAYTAL